MQQTTHQGDLVRYILTIIIGGLIVLSQSTTTVQADAFHPSRVRLIVHDHLKQFSTEIVPGPDLKKGLSPLAYLGIKYKLTDSLIAEPMVGWDFLLDEPILSVRLAPDKGRY